MTRQFQHICKLLAKLVVILFVASGYSCKARMQLEVKTPVMDRDLPDETSYNVKLTELEGGRVDYILKADKIERFYDRKVLNAWKVEITAYDIAGNIRSTINADTTIVDDARNIIFSSGNVRMTSPNGNISTRKIIWDRNMDEILAPERVVLTRQGSVLKGSRLRTNSSISFAEMASVEAEGFFQDEEIIDW